MQEVTDQVAHLEREIAKLKKQLKQLEEEKTNETTWFQNIIDSFPNPLFLKDSKTNFVLINKAFEELSGRSKSELLGKSDRDFFPQKQALIFNRIDDEVLTNGEINWNEEQLTTNEITHNLITSKVRVEDSEGRKYLLGLITEITDKANQQIELMQKKDQLEEEKKNVQILLKEVHHRVKNNLQVVSSLLNLQMNRFEDEQVKMAFSNCKNRIIAMSNVHEILYRTDNFSKINFAFYCRTLVEEIKQSNDISNEVIFNQQLINIFFNVEIAIPLGLIINELLVNSIKHAKVENRILTIDIQLRVKNGYCYFELGDDGKGILPNRYSNNQSFGMELVHLFCKQINADIKLLNQSVGSHYQIKFKNRKKGRR